METPLEFRTFSHTWHTREVAVIYARIVWHFTLFFVSRHCQLDFMNSSENSEKVEIYHQIMVFYSFVDLHECNERFVVKTAWCKNINNAKTRTKGNNAKIERLIFHSPNHKEMPNFKLPVQKKFDATKAACYKGFILKSFGAQFIIIHTTQVFKN